MLPNNVSTFVVSSLVVAQDFCLMWAIICANKQSGTSLYNYLSPVLSNIVKDKIEIKIILVNAVDRIKGMIESWERHFIKKSEAEDNTL